MIFWTLIFVVALVCVVAAYAVWRRGYTVQELVHNPPQEVDLPQFVTTLGYLHHELIKHRLPLVRTVADQPLDQVDSTDVEMLKQAVTGASGRPSLVGELEGYLGGLRRAAGRVHLNFWRDAMVRRAKGACHQIQKVADGLEERASLTHSEHQRLRSADKVLDRWFRPRLQALRNSVVSFELRPEIFDEPVERVLRELGFGDAEIERPNIPEGLHARMLRTDFNLVLRNLVRNSLQRSVHATGEARLAIEVNQRIELTGEESVLLRIHDTDPTLLTRQQLYGGQIGRGLNLVTTTLRRYDAALSCAPSKLDGYAKYMEVRLFQAHADPAEVAVLRKPDPLAWAVPAGLVSTLSMIGAVCAAGWFGMLPDPMAGLLNETQTTNPVVEAERKARQDAVTIASDKIAGAFVMGEREAEMADPEMARHRIPGPPDIDVVIKKTGKGQQPRCDQPERFTDARRINLKCHLEDSRHKLRSPVLIFEIPKPYDASLMSAEVKDMVLKGRRGAKTIEPGARCSKVALLSPGEEIPKATAARLAPSIPRKSSKNRLIFDYQGCLAMPRYPVQAQITIQRPRGSAELPDVPGIRPTTIDLRIQLRRVDEAEKAFSKISNSDRHLPTRADRTDLVKAIARHVQEEMTYGGESAPGYSEENLGKAYYFGWVRPGLYDGIWSRVEGVRGRKPPTSAICGLHDQIMEGFGYLQELDPKVVRADLYRSQYYSYHSRLWILGDIPGAMLDLEKFQRDYGRQTDFVQGARLYLALLTAMSPPPTPEDLEDADSRKYLVRITGLLKALRRDSSKPPKRGSEYDKIKLLGYRSLVGQGDEGFEANDVLCAFSQVHSAWVSQMPDPAYNRIFSHCPNFLLRTPPVEPDENDPDAGLADPPDADAKAPLKRVVSGPIANATQYMKALDEMLRSMRWSCPEEKD